MSAPDEMLRSWFSGLDLADLLTHPSATGAGVRVAVIDTGIDTARLSPKAASRVVSCIRMVPDRLEPLAVEGPPGSPHGTTVGDILLSLAPDVEIYSADVFGTRGTCDVEVLFRALRYALDVWNCRVINLSLGISEGQLTQTPRRLALLRVIEEAYFRNVMVIAAAGNDSPLTRSYPAAFGPPVFGVGLHDGQDLRDIRYRPHERIEFQARACGQIGPLASVPATSWAAPHVSGVIAQFLSLRPELTPFEVKTLLARLSAGHPSRGLRSEPRIC